MKILITGSSGLIGSALVPFLRKRGHQVKKLTRKAGALSDDELAWDPSQPVAYRSEFEGYDAVINLAGESIASGRWTEEKKRKIRDSRVHGTRVLCETLGLLKTPPKVLINGSAMGYYGDQEEAVLTEESRAGTTFLAQVCRDWENATAPAKQKGMRVVCLRTGMVLSKQGGALAKMLGPFKLGLGGVLGSGKQYISWITDDELVHVVEYLLTHPSLYGPINVGTPYPVTNREFTKALGAVLGRPTLLPMPTWLVRFVFGEMGEELLLGSTRMAPRRLIESGYAFRYPHLEAALRHLLS